MQTTQLRDKSRRTDNLTQLAKRDVQGNGESSGAGAPQIGSEPTQGGRDAREGEGEREDEEDVSPCDTIIE